jgi:hypothetical protein
VLLFFIYKKTSSRYKFLVFLFIKESNLLLFIVRLNPYKMNWKLILQLSLFGLVMAIATVFWIPSNIEPIFWLIIFIICAYFIAKNTTGNYFWHGFLVSIVNCIWITSAHIILFHSYIPNHPQEADMISKMPMPDSPRMMMLMTGPVIGIISGLILGFFAFLASKILKRNTVANQ